MAAKGKIVGYDFVEVVPSADVGNMTSYLILTLLGALCHTGQIGKEVRQRLRTTQRAQVGLP